MYAKTEGEKRKIDKNTISFCKINLSELNKEQMADRINMPYVFFSRNTTEKKCTFPA